MGRHRTKSVWVGGTGWVVKKTTTDRSYDEYVNESWAFLISFWRWYPDQLLDILRSPDADYESDLIQRVLLRAFARYQLVTITGSRGMTKTTCAMQYHELHGILWPNNKTSYYGPSYKQQAELAKNAHEDITHDYPLLAKHYQIDSSGKDAFGISTEHNSSVTINAMRGKNLSDVTAEEFAQADGNSRFDFEEYTAVVLYAVRLVHKVQGRADPTAINYRQRAITSAGARQNHAYETRCKHLAAMLAGKSAFVADIPWQVVVLSQMRPYEWAVQRKSESTPDKWAREMESRYSGTDENPMVRDTVLHECQQLACMEEHHCCKDIGCKLRPEDVIYVIGYDVSYADGISNAKCALVVVKLTKQEAWNKKDKYLKEVVYVDDWAPRDAIKQAEKVKQIWNRFSYEGSETYIAIDAWQYGTSVVQALMTDLGDGMAPLCIYKHDSFTEYEREGALPVIYPIKAGGVGTTDPDSEMVRNAQLNFEYRNVRLLTSNSGEGIEAYKRRHRIKDDSSDANIYQPYLKTRELVGQIQNLKVINGAEKRISNLIQRDSWSALKYALRFAQKLEHSNLLKQKKKSDWDALLQQYSNSNNALRRYYGQSSNSRIIGRQGGKLF